jgi:hypothetical protein
LGLGKFEVVVTEENGMPETLIVSDPEIVMGKPTMAVRAAVAFADPGIFDEKNISYRLLTRARLSRFESIRRKLTGRDD